MAGRDNWPGALLFPARNGGCWYRQMTVKGNVGMMVHDTAR